MPKAPAGAKYILASGVLPTFQRREKTFKLRLFDEKLALVAEFDAPNPKYRRYPAWKPEDLPAAHQNGDLTASLLRFENRWSGSRRFELQLKQFSLTPEFHLGEGSHAATDWKLDNLDVEDAAGNRAIMDEPHVGVLRRRQRMIGISDRNPVSAQFNLCTHETAWKLHASFLRTPQARFSSNETWTIPNLEIPSPGEAKTLTGSNIWQGVTVRLCAVAGPGDITYSNGVPVSVAIPSGRRGGSASGRMVGGVLVSEMSVATDKPQVMIQISGLNEESRFQVIARTGGLIHICPESSSGNDYKLFQLSVPDGTDSVDLTFVVHQPRVIDFLVRPELPVDR